MATGVRTKDYKQFNVDMPDLSVVQGIQSIEIKYDNKCSSYPGIWIDGHEHRIYHNPEIFTKLTRNDGFDKLSDFLAWFPHDFAGKIIHWTDLKY